MHPALAHPAVQPRRVAVAQPVIRHVLRHHRARADEAVAAQRDPANDRGVRTDRCAALHQRALVLVLAVYMTARVEHVGKDHRWSQERVILNDHPGIDRDVILDLNVVANDAFRRNNDVLPDIAAAADARGCHNMTEMPDLRPIADLGAVVHIT